MDNKPLRGIRVIEVGQLLAGPFAGTLLAYFGAEVIKVEPPGEGDPIRGWRLLDNDGTSFWWRSLGRNKKSLTLNLRSPEGREVLGQLLDDADVLIENFKPGTMEKWGLGPEAVKATNPGLIYTRISGYGQTGPYSSKPGYASVTEAYSGFRYINGFGGEVPVRPNLSWATVSLDCMPPWAYCWHCWRANPRVRHHRTGGRCRPLRIHVQSDGGHRAGVFRGR